MSKIEEVDCIQGLGETFSDDYRAAVVHVAWERKKDRRTLLLAWVELLPCEIAPPHDDGETWKRIQDSYLYVRHVVTTAERALRWYRDCAEGVAVRPEEGDDSLPERSPTVITLAMSPTDEEPRWPNLICTRSPILPFLGNWHECPRVHHLMAPTFKLDSLWNDNQQERALHWLSEQLHFDVASRRFLLGSVHLVAPNPVFRELRQRIEAPDSSRERILLHVQARAGQSAVGLHLRFLEHRSTGICVSKQWTLKGPSLSIQVNHILSEFAVEIHDPRRGLLWFEPPISIIQSIGFQMSVASGVREIRDQHGPVLKVPLVTDMSPTSVGTPAVRSQGFMQLGEAADMHQQRETRRALERWFKDQRDEANDTVHKLIQDATQRVVIVDPYFARPELRFAVAISRLKVPVFVLTSHDGLIEREKNGELPESFVESVERITSTRNTNPLEVRVMPGAGIHDRFLIVDDRVFSLGSSLNNFGKRGTMIVQLHTPGVVRDELLRELATSDPLHQWLDARRAAQQVQASGPPASEARVDQLGEGM